MANGSQMTLGQWQPEIFREQTVGASDSHARTSVLPEDKRDFTETAQACFSELCTFLDSKKKKRSPLTYSLRMLKICLVLMEDGTLPDFSLRWIGGGTMRSGTFSTQSISESRKTGNGVLLSDILEVEVPQKYFLSKEQTERIVFTESDTETDTGGTHKSSIGGGITEALDTADGGGRGHHTIEVIGKSYDRDNYGDNRNRVLGEGGARFGQLLNAGKSNKKRKSRGRYGEHIRHELQPGHIRSDIGRTDSICCLVSKEAMLHSDTKTNTERVLPAARLDR